jgi:hypothetical protein
MESPYQVPSAGSSSSWLLVATPTPSVDAAADPVGSLRAGWELHVGFGLANPELFRLMHTALRTPQGRAAAATGAGVLQARVHRVAEAGRRRIPVRARVKNKRAKRPRQSGAGVSEFLR